MELKFYYSNMQPIPVKFAFTFRIINIDKEYVFYGLGEESTDMEVVYFGELIGNVMAPVNQYDLEAFKKFIMLLAANQITSDSFEYLQTIHNNLDVEVRGGQKTQISKNVLENYKKTPDPSLLYGVNNSQPVAEQPQEVVGMQPAAEQLQPVVEATPSVEVPTDSNVVQPEETTTESTVAPAKAKKEKDPKQKKKIMIALIVVIIVILLGIGVYFGYLWIKNNNSKPSQKPVEPTPPVVETKTLTCTKDSTSDISNIKQTQLIKFHFKNKKLMLVEDSINSTFPTEVDYTIAKEETTDTFPKGVTQTKNCNDTSLTCLVTKNLNVLNMDDATKTENNIIAEFSLEQYQEHYTGIGFTCE